MVARTYWGAPSDDWVRPLTREMAGFLGRPDAPTPVPIRRAGERCCDLRHRAVHRSITWKKIRILGETFNAVMQFDPAVTRVGGEWTIVNIMFEPRPMSCPMSWPNLPRG